MITLSLLALVLTLAALSFGVLAGVKIVVRKETENALIGLNVAVICSVTGLVLLQKYFGVAFSRDIAFYMIFPGFIGIIVYAKFLRGRIF